MSRPELVKRTSRLSSARLPRSESPSALGNARSPRQLRVSAQRFDDRFQCQRHDEEQSLEDTTSEESGPPGKVDQENASTKAKAASVRPPVKQTRSTQSIWDPNLVSGPEPSEPSTDRLPKVTWGGPDDPENPKNWTKGQRWAAVLVVSSFKFISPVASSMVAPALSSIASDFNITNEVEEQLVMSAFVLAYAIGPLFLGPLSEIYGRVPVLQLANVLFLIFNTACGGSRNKGQLIAFRFLSGLGGSAPLALGGGVLSDCWDADDRGRALSIYTLAPLLGPAIGPIVGGFIAENTTWRWIFFVVSFADALVQLSGLFFLRETYPPKLLHKKAKHLREETGNSALHTKFENKERSLLNTLKRALTRPVKMLATQPAVQVLAIYMAYLYGLLYLVLSTFPRLWTGAYGESIGIGGLNYISLALGFFLGSQICAPLNDNIYRRLKHRNEGLGKPEFRAPLMIPGSILVPCGLFVYGWSAQYQTHWIVPNVGAVIFATGVCVGFQCINIYLVDSYTTYAASAISATTVLRSFAGFGFPLFAPYMYHTLDYAWGNSLLGFIAIGIGLPAPVLLWFYGEKIRERSPFAAG